MFASAERDPGKLWKHESVAEDPGDVLLCPHCSETRRVLVAIHDPDSVRKVLGARGLSAAVPELAHVPRAG
jgi:hypothetical protein